MRTSRVVVVALCGVLGLAGCGGGDDDGGDSAEDRADTPAATSSPEEAAEGAATETPTPAAESETEDPLASRTVKSRTRATTTIDITVNSLRVDGELAYLELSFTPHDTEPDTYSASEMSLIDHSGTGGAAELLVSLVDPVNLKRYLVVNDSDDDALEPDLRATRTELDATAVSTHTFAAPPPDVNEIDVSVGDFTTFHDIPIER
jgi:hypothetical protein